MKFTVQQFFQVFPTDESCLAHLMKIRFGETIDCPKCKKTGRFTKLTNMPAFACSWCGHHIHPMAGTPFQASHTSLQKWFYAMYLFTTSRHGVPAKELQRQLGVTYKTAWRMGHEIRKYMGKVDGHPPLNGKVEADETYLGGKRPGKRGRGAAGKTVVFGMMEREGNVMTHVVPNVKRKTLHPHMEANIEKGSTIHTDELPSYRTIDEKGYAHETVNHGEGQYAHKGVHVNSIEGFWSQIKRSIKGTHVHVSGKHTPKYLGEFEFRYNMRKTPTLMWPRLLTSF
jgi:transposase-like protein